MLLFALPQELLHQAPGFEDLPDEPESGVVVPLHCLQFRHLLEYAIVLFLFSYEF